MDLSISLDTNEADLIAACVRNEEWAQKALYESFYPVLYPICIRYAIDKEQALDILHEGYIKVFRYIGRYQSGTNLKAWIKRIIVNTAIDHYRKNSKMRTSDIEQAYHVSSLDADAISQINAEDIMSAIQELPDQYRTIFNLFIIDGYSHQEIGEKLNINESTSRSNLAKARKKLKSIIVRKGIVDHVR